MPIRAQLFVEDHRFEVLDAETLYYKYTTPTGFPDTPLLGGRLHVQLLSDRFSPLFFGWTLHQALKHAYLRFYDRFGSKEFDLFLYDCYCTHFHESFVYNRAPSLLLNLTLSPGIQKLRDQVFVKPWHVSNPDSLPAVTEEELAAFRAGVGVAETREDKRCRVEFEVSGSEAEEGVFGWDAHQDNYRRICDNYETLRDKEYPPLKIDNRDYYVPWLSLRKGQTITLGLDKLVRGSYERITLSAGGAPLKIDPEDVKEAGRVQLTCTGDLPQPLQLKVEADGQLAGALNIWQRPVKTVEVRWVLVEIQGNDKDRDDLKKKITKVKLEQWLQKALNPALIDVKLVNPEAEILDLTALDNSNNLVKTQLKRFRSSFAPHTADRVEDTLTAKTEFLGSLTRLYTHQKTQQNQPPVPEEIILFLTHLYCGSPGDTGTNYTNGISFTGGGVAAMFLKNEQLTPSEEIPHEVLHALGLPHSFKDTNSQSATSSYTFTKGRTRNYMDYSTRRYQTCKWQWELLHQSRFAK